VLLSALELAALLLHRQSYRTPIHLSVAGDLVDGVWAPDRGPHSGRDIDGCDGCGPHACAAHVVPDDDADVHALLLPHDWLGQISISQREIWLGESRTSDFLSNFCISLNLFPTQNTQNNDKILPGFISLLSSLQGFWIY
jgi:hypothetical protein